MRARRDDGFGRGSGAPAARLPPGGEDRGYQRFDIDETVVCYMSPGLCRPGRLEPDEAYARARAVIPTWCLDGLVCARNANGTRLVILPVRSGDRPGDGPFRRHPWVVGGKWDMVTPWKRFVRAKALAELFGGVDLPLTIRGPIGPQLFATGWAGGADGPFGEQGMTLQYCYQVVLSEAFDVGLLKPDAYHSQPLIVRVGQPLPALHPYIRHVIRLSGWLDA